MGQHHLFVQQWMKQALVWRENSLLTTRRCMPVWIAPMAPFPSQLGTESFGDFFSHFEKSDDISLTLTKEVMAECKQFEVTLPQKIFRIRFSLC